MRPQANNLVSILAVFTLHFEFLAYGDNTQSPAPLHVCDVALRAVGNSSKLLKSPRHGQVETTPLRRLLHSAGIVRLKPTEVFWVHNDSAARDPSYYLMQKRPGNFVFSRPDVRRTEDDYAVDWSNPSEMHSGRLMFVVDTNGNLILGLRSVGPHPTLIGGKDPQVLASGELVIQNGKLFRIEYSDSGHYRPDETTLPVARTVITKAFSKYPSIYHPQFDPETSYVRELIAK